MPNFQPKAFRDGTLSLNEVFEAAQDAQSDLSNPGFCLSCGAHVDGVEPDARGYDCPECGDAKVYGAEEIILMTA